MVTLVQDTPKVRTEPSGRSASAQAIRTLLTHVSGDPQEAPRLRAAVALARDLDATLVGVGCEMMPPLGAGDPTGMMEAQWILGMQEVVRTDLERARKFFEAEAKDIETDWIEFEDLPSDAIARLSRGADLIVAGGSTARRVERYRSVDAGDIMLRAGRPVLVAPPSGGRLTARSVVVAWKDTREARRALADALPFLRAADNVLVVDVCHRDQVEHAEARTTAVLKGLARHDVIAQAKIVEAPSENVATQLEASAKAIGADLIVAGGYGHSRLGEWFFGGVTRDLLAGSDRFVLLSH